MDNQNKDAFSRVLWHIDFYATAHILSLNKTYSNYNRYWDTGDIALYHEKK